MIFRALDATWPPARLIETGPWTLREGRGGGQRVSAATANSPVSETDIAGAVEGMRALGQLPIFMIRPDDDALDGWLELRDYGRVDPVTIYLARAGDIAAELPPAKVTASWPPLAVQTEIWSEAGIGPPRLAVMTRAEVPKTTLLGRAGDAPGGVAYIASAGSIAMLHALEVAPQARRQSLATAMMQAAAAWSLRNGATWLTLAVTAANAPANALYRRLSMRPAAHYHYRRAPEVAA